MNTTLRVERIEPGVYELRHHGLTVGDIRRDEKSQWVWTYGQISGEAAYLSAAVTELIDAYRLYKDS